jgi:hypothetical protein
MDRIITVIKTDIDFENKIHILDEMFKGQENVQAMMMSEFLQNKGNFSKDDIGLLAGFMLKYTMHMSAKNNKLGKIGKKLKKIRKNKKKEEDNDDDVETKDVEEIEEVRC